MKERDDQSGAFLFYVPFCRISYLLLILIKTERVFDLLTT